MPQIVSERMGPRRLRQVLFTALILLLTSYLVFLFRLPLLPTTDGPVHMYYVHVLQALLDHSNPVYLHFFRVRHLLPPYSLYYYALLALSHFVPMVVADKLIISVYFISFLFGFRFFARAIGGSADLMTIGASLLLLNWPLGMGFVNFCLALSFTFWAAGLWLRIMGTSRIRARIGLVLLTTMVMLTHPVPLLLLLIVMGATLLARIAVSFSRSAGESKGKVPQFWKEDVITLAAAAANVAYVKLFARANPFQQIADGPAVPYWSALHTRLNQYAAEHGLLFIMGRSPEVLMYRVGLLLVLVLSAFLAVQQFTRNRRAGIWTTGDSFLVLSVIAALGLPFVPSQLNGLYYFADRLLMVVWICFLLAASGWSPLPNGARAESVNRRYSLAVIVGLSIVSVATTGLLLRSSRLLQVPANSIAAALSRPLPLKGKVGFVFEDERTPIPQNGDSLSWDPYYWALVHLFRRNDAVLANAPWMNESIIPVAPTYDLPESSNLALQQPFPNKLEKTFRNDLPDLRSALRADDFFVVNQNDHAPLSTEEPLLRMAPGSKQRWSCLLSTKWYRLCMRDTVSR